ncbi:MAG: hypothetical protein IT450_08855 [Phycisphaerales bacterium]|nr:hypothetical protein [Phycisphaerales bacterium]
MRKFWMGTAMAIAMAAVAMAQDTTNDGLLGGLLSGGAIGLVVLAVLAFFVWQWFIG